MTYAGNHRDVEFAIRRENGAWRFTINKQSFGQYSEREHAISAAIRHIDTVLFEAARRKDVGQ
jgi:hypothetical protein